MKRTTMYLEGEEFEVLWDGQRHNGWCLVWLEPDEAERVAGHMGGEYGGVDSGGNEKYVFVNGPLTTEYFSMDFEKYGRLFPLGWGEWPWMTVEEWYGDDDQ